MKRIFLLGAALIGSGCMTEPVRAPDAADAAALADETEGRTPGAAVSCVNMRDLRSNRPVGDAIVFDGPGGSIYVNRPVGGCPNLRHGRTLIIQTTVTQLCRGDIAQVVDHASGTNHGSCALGDFMPYGRRGG